MQKQTIAWEKSTAHIWQRLVSRIYKEPTNKKKNLIGKRFEHQKIHRWQNHKEKPLCTYRNGWKAETLTIPNAAPTIQRDWNSHTRLGGMWNGSAIPGQSLTLSQKANIGLPQDPAITVLDPTISRKNKSRWSHEDLSKIIQRLYL